MVDPVNAAICSAGQSFTQTQVGLEACPLAAQTIIDRSVTSWLSFHPILFAPNENPESAAQFKVQKPTTYKTGHLLADGRSKAVIRLTLLKLPPNFVVKQTTVLDKADSGWHGGEGTITLALSDPRAGTLAYRGRTGATLQFPTSAVSTGETSMDPASPDAVIFTAGQDAAEAQLTVTIQGMGSWTYLPGVLIPKNARDTGERHDLTVGTRIFGKDAQGWDVLKAQWYLHRFAFMAHTVVEAAPNNSDRAWQQIKEIRTTGVLDPPLVNAVKDFRIVALGGYRNRQAKSVPITFVTAATAGDTVTPAVAVEMAHWDDSGYKVECFHGDMTLKTGPDDQLETVAAKITYGVVHDDAKPIGYVDIQDPIGNSSVVRSSERIDVAAAWRSAIRMFNKDMMVWRLHDADKDERALIPEINSTFIERVKTCLIQLRRMQAAAQDKASGNRDVFIGREAFRTVEDQQKIYAKGRTTTGDGPCGCNYPGTYPVPDTVALPCPRHPTEGCHCKILQGKCKRIVGDKHHVFGSIATDAQSGKSWHEYGLAFDIQFSTGGHPATATEKRDPGGSPEERPSDGSYRALGERAVANNMKQGYHKDGVHKDLAHIQPAETPERVPPEVHAAYDSAANDTLTKKLKAVWALYNLNPATPASASPGN